MITKNGVKYVLRGSAEDTGEYKYYYISTTIEKTNIIYLGLKGYAKITKHIYLDEETDSVIKRDYISYEIRYGIITLQGTCTDAASEQEIYDFIHNNEDTSGGGDENQNLSDLDDDTVLEWDESEPMQSEEEFEDNYPSDDSDSDNIFENDKDNSSSDLDTGRNPIEDNLLGPDADSYDPKRPEKESSIANKGTTYPIIRINDHYYKESEIEYFSMETGMYKNYFEYQLYQQPISGFIPTFKLVVRTSDKNVLKQDYPKQGDRCAIFFSAHHNLIKSMRCDFKITNVVTNKMPLNVLERYTTQIITGELYVPDLRNEEIRYNFNGSSRDAMMDIAKRLRLSYIFCDPEDTSDVMVWCNFKSPEFFIKDLTTHSWKSPDAFFESWIDPRYGLAFINVNKMLGESGLDEPIDVTLWVNTFMQNRGADSRSTEKDAKAKTDPQAKLFTNMPIADESGTVYHVNAWRLINNALEIQDYIGLNCKMLFESINPGLKEENSKYDVEYSMCINRDKFDPDPKMKDINEFFVLLGPGRNKTYSSGDTAMGASETQSSNTKDPEQVVNQLSDGDASNINDSNGNMFASGNTHKFYEVAYEHNMRNLLLLQKLYVEIETNGANLTIVRGERVPMLLFDNDKASLLWHPSTNPGSKLTECIYETESGWYIIDGIEWVYDKNDINTIGTNWKTRVRLTRREWPVPTTKAHMADKENYQKEQEQERIRKAKEAAESAKNLITIKDKDGSTVKLAYKDAIAKFGEEYVQKNGEYIADEVVVTAGTLATDSSKIDSSTGTPAVTAVPQAPEVQGPLVDNTTADLPLTGLKDFMKELYKLISTETNNKVKLVSGRRWAVNEYGLKIETYSNAYIKKNGYYKCVNVLGNVLYFKTNNSRHLYGEAIDIINDGMDFSDLMTKVVMKSGKILLHMYNYGISAYIEQAKDDMGVTTKHYHFGTDTTKQKEFWLSVKAITGTDKIPGTTITFSNYMKNNTYSSSEVRKEDIDENTIKVVNTTPTNNNASGSGTTGTDGVIKGANGYTVFVNGAYCGTFTTEEEANKVYSDNKSALSNLSVNSASTSNTPTSSNTKPSGGTDGVIKGANGYTVFVNGAYCGTFTTEEEANKVYSDNSNKNSTSNATSSGGTDGVIKGANGYTVFINGAYMGTFTTEEEANKVYSDNSIKTNNTSNASSNTGGTNTALSPASKDYDDEKKGLRYGYIKGDGVYTAYWDYKVIGTFPFVLGDSADKTRAYNEVKECYERYKKSLVGDYTNIKYILFETESAAKSSLATMTNYRSDPSEPPIVYSFKASAKTENIGKFFVLIKLNIKGPYNTLEEAQKAALEMY